MKSLLIALWLLLLNSSFCLAIAPINDDTIKEAQIYGKINSANNFTDFISPWTSYEENAQKLDDRTEYANLYTPFLLVAADAREKSLNGQAIRIVDSRKVLQPYAGYLTFRVLLFGSTPQFSESVKCVLKINDNTFNFYQSLPGEVTKAPWYPSQPLYMSKHYFYFIDNEIDFNAHATLIINTADKREHKFHFNLRNIR